MQNVVGENQLSRTGSLLLLAEQGFTAKVRDCFLVGYGTCQLLIKNQIDVIDRTPNFVLSVVFSALIVGGWMVLAWSRKSYLGPAEIMYMCDDPIETVECIWVNIWCMLDWIGSQNCRNTLLLHTAGQLVRRTKPDGAISDCENWDISGSWLHNVLVLRGKKEATIAWCGLRVKKQLFCDLVQ